MIGRFLATCTVFALCLAACGDPGLPRLVDDQQAARLIQAVQQAVDNQGRDETPTGTVAGAIVTIYDNHGNQSSAGVFGNDLTACVIQAATRLGVTGIEPTFVSVHVLRDLRKVRWARLREAGFGYHRGLYAVARVSGGKARAFSEVDMHVRGLTVEAALSRLNDGKGTALHGKMPADGAYLAATESFTNDPTGRLVRLYRASSPLPSLTGSQIGAYLLLGGDYLCRLLQDDNRFVYEGDVGRDTTTNNYNQLRHAGTIYALYQLYQATGVPTYRETADRAWTWLMAQVRTDRDSRGNVCAYTVEDGKIKLGSSGLTLIALSERLRINRNDADLALGRQLANHILRSQRPNGSLASYHALPGKKAKRQRSIYYPGEAMLGLIRFYQFDPNPAYVNAVAKAADYLIHDRWRVIGLELFVPPDAWLMLALNELHQVRPQADYADYCLKLADGMMADQLLADWQVPYPDYRGGYFPYAPQVTPAGSRMEGLTAAYLVAQRTGRDTTALKRTIAAAARFQLQCMIRPEFAHLYPKPQMALGAFRHSPISNRVRIDYNQHNISGLLVAAKILSN